ncbi:MAG: molybdopterin-binding protein [Anaerolineae bacterium]
MTAEILSTGDEVLLGDLVDTNSAFLCDRLKQMGIRVSQITVKGDDVDAVCDTVQAISRRTRLCLVTGGLGPTQDDVTALACAKALGESLVLNPSALASMKTYFDRRGFELNNPFISSRSTDILAGDPTPGTFPGRGTMTLTSLAFLPLWIVCRGVRMFPRCSSGSIPIASSQWRLPPLC